VLLRCVGGLSQKLVSEDVSRSRHRSVMYQTCEVYFVRAKDDVGRCCGSAVCRTGQQVVDLVYSWASLARRCARSFAFVHSAEP
jgi:hypothetical protein